MGLGVIELVCVAVYAIPWTSPLGAILLTGYLGGAVACRLRAGHSLFDTVFPIIIGVLVWGGLRLRDQRLRALIPFCSEPRRTTTAEMPRRLGYGERNDRSTRAAHP